MAIIDRLMVLVGYEADEKSIKDVQQSYEGLKTALLGVSAVGAATYGVLFELTRRKSASIETNYNFAKSIGVEYEALQRMGHAAESVGSSIDSSNNQIASFIELSRSLKEEGSLAFEQLALAGIENPISLISDDPVETFRNVARIFPSLRGENIKQAASALRISDDLIPLFQAGVGEVDRLIEQAGKLGRVIDEDVAEEVVRFQREMREVEGVFKGTNKLLTAQLAPVMADTVKLLREWLVENQARIVEILTGVIKAFTNVSYIALKSMGFILEWATKLVNLITDIKPLVVATGIVSFIYFAKILLPLMLGIVGAIGNIAKGLIALRTAFISTFIVPAAFMAGLILIALAIEDIYTYFTGGESLLGEWIARSETLASVFESIETTIKSIYDFWEPIFGGEQTFNNQMDVFSKRIATSALTTPEEYANAPWWQKIDASPTGSGILWSWLQNVAGPYLWESLNFLNTPTADIRSGLGLGGNTINMSVVNNINGATNPQEVSKMVNEGIRREFDSNTDLNKGAVE